MPIYSEAELETLIQDEVDENYEQRLAEIKLEHFVDLHAQYYDETTNKIYIIDGPEMILANEIFDRLEIVKSQWQDAFQVVAECFVEKRS
jgi:CO dehydrogenase/acetyl-CoA synthase alpha subunit